MNAATRNAADNLVQALAAGDDLRAIIYRRAYRLQKKLVLLRSIREFLFLFQQARKESERRTKLAQDVAEKAVREWGESHDEWCIDPGFGPCWDISGPNQPYDLNDIPF